MNVIDSSVWLEYFSRGPNAEAFIAIIEDAEASVVPTICMHEVYKRLKCLHGSSAANEAVGTMLLGTPIPLSTEISLRAADLSLQYKLPTADSIILATAYVTESTLWTQDSHFEDVPGVRYFKK